MYFFTACWCRDLWNRALGLDRKRHVLQHWQDNHSDPWPCPHLHHQWRSDVCHWFLWMYWCPQGKHMSPHVCKSAYLLRLKEKGVNAFIDLVSLLLLIAFSPSQGWIVTYFLVIPDYNLDTEKSWVFLKRNKLLI